MPTALALQDADASISERDCHVDESIVIQVGKGYIVNNETTGIDRRQAAEYSGPVVEKYLHGIELDVARGNQIDGSIVVDVGAEQKVPIHIVEADIGLLRSRIELSIAAADVRNRVRAV